MAGSDFVLTGSRLQNATRVNQAAEDADVADWPKANDFILCAMVETTAHGGASGTLQLRWRNVTDSGSFVVLSGTGELTWSGTTDLANGNAVASGEEVCTGVVATLVDGVEREGANDVSTTINQNEKTEHQWAVDSSGGVDAKQYEFEIYDATAGAAVGTCLAQITTESVVLQNGVDFDGANDWIDGIDTTSSMSDGKTWSFSFWVKPSSLGSNPQLRNSTSARVGLSFATGDASGVKLRMRLENASNTIILDATTDDADIKFDRWNHCCGNVDLNVATQTADIVINRVTQTFTSPTITDDDIDFTVGDNSIGGGITGNFKLTGALQEYWEHTDNIDFTSASELNKVITTDGNWVLLGSDGSTPTGNQPHIYLRDPYDSWEKNYGSLGDFTVNGALADEGTLPALPVAGRIMSSLVGAGGLAGQGGLVGQGGGLAG